MVYSPNSICVPTVGLHFSLSSSWNQQVTIHACLQLPYNKSSLIKRWTFPWYCPLKCSVFHKNWRVTLPFAWTSCQQRSCTPATFLLLSHSRCQVKKFNIFHRHFSSVMWQPQHTRLQSGSQVALSGHYHSAAVPLPLQPGWGEFQGATQTVMLLQKFIKNFFQSSTSLQWHYPGNANSLAHWGWDMHLPTADLRSACSSSSCTFYFFRKRSLLSSGQMSKGSSPSNLVLCMKQLRWLPLPILKSDQGFPPALYLESQQWRGSTSQLHIVASA